MTEGNFERLMMGIREIVAERVDTPPFLDDLFRDFTFPISQELNAGAVVMSLECEFEE